MEGEGDDDDDRGQNRDGRERKVSSDTSAHCRRFIVMKSTRRVLGKNEGSQEDGDKAASDLYTPIVHSVDMSTL